MGSFEGFLTAFIQDMLEQKSNMTWNNAKRRETEKSKVADGYKNFFPLK